MNEPERFADERLAQISSALRNWVSNGMLPCAGLALVTGDGASYCRTEGFASVERHDALSPATVVRITSMGKAIVVTAFFTMIEQGCFALHDPVSRYLPEFAKLQVMAPDGRRDMARPLTLHHLLTHTSGITHDKFLPDHPAADAYREMRPLATEQSLAAFADMVAMLPLLFQPDTAFRYGYSIDILGRVMEAVAERPLEQLLEQRIFAPLGMPDTGFQVTGEQLNRFASPRCVPSAPQAGFTCWKTHPTVATCACHARRLAAMAWFLP